MDSSPAAPAALPTDLRLDLVALAVADLDRSRAWYRDVVGLEPIEDEPADPASEGTDGTLTLGAHGRGVVRLVHQPGAGRAPRGATGLYHLAILLPSRAALGSFVRRLVEERIPVVGASDHAVSEAIYFEDPDGHGVEVYADRPRATWAWRDGRVAMTTEPLDVDDLVAAADGAYRGAPNGTTLGHVHLRVRDAEEADRFYAGTVGLDTVAAFPGATFLSVGGYHHHVGANAWESRGGAPAPEDAARLLAVHASLGDAGALEALHDRIGDATLDRSRDALTFHDPSGNLWHLHARGD